jgi:hypothetical protein
MASLYLSGWTRRKRCQTSRNWWAHTHTGNGINCCTCLSHALWHLSNHALRLLSDSKGVIFDPIHTPLCNRQDIYIYERYTRSFEGGQSLQCINYHTLFDKVCEQGPSNSAYEVLKAVRQENSSSALIFRGVERALQHYLQQTLFPVTNKSEAWSP